jgi:DNA modification methylase
MNTDTDKENNYIIYHGDCLEQLKKLDDDIIDSIVTDPPYGLSKHDTDKVIDCLSAWISGKPYEPNGSGFMGKTWDAWVPGPEIWKECLRVLKPGGHILAFSGTRSMDLMAISIRLAGFELRDSIGYTHSGNDAPLLAYTFGSGFPKSHNVSIAIDKAAGAEREVVGQRDTFTGSNKETNWKCSSPRLMDITVPATPEAKQWSGWGTALKPAWEPIILARKPLIGTVAENVLQYGTGALNIDGCRIDANGEKTGGNGYIGLKQSKGWNANNMPYKREQEQSTTQGRWPANVTHDGSDEVLRLFPEAKSRSNKGPSFNKIDEYGFTSPHECGSEYNHDKPGEIGSAARFFYCAKASKKDRNSGDTNNTHTTVKPTDLMRWLVRLVTQTNGIVLDPFMGSGSTGKACMLEGFRFIGIEREAEYVEIAKARLDHAMKIDTDKSKSNKKNTVTKTVTRGSPTDNVLDI